MQRVELEHLQKQMFHELGETVKFEDCFATVKPYRASVEAANGSARGKSAAVWNEAIIPQTRRPPALRPGSCFGFWRSGWRVA